MGTNHELYNVYASSDPHQITWWALWKHPWTLNPIELLMYVTTNINDHFKIQARFKLSIRLSSFSSAYKI
jgi:hypothetical protein